MQGILNKEHIKLVLKEAKNPVYRMDGAISFAVGASSPLAIVKITRNGLIFIKGTDDTGFDHILKRHSSDSDNKYWTNFYDNKGNIVEKEDKFGRRKFKLDNPSSFHPYSIPIKDYLDIADQVFQTSNLKNERNKRKDLFDLYENEAFGLDGNKVTYRLLLYKDSKIVHTLFPTSKVFNKRKKHVIHFARQNPRRIIKLLNDDSQIEIPYKDEYSIIRYMVIIRNDVNNEEIENWYIQMNAPDESPVLTHYFNRRMKDCDTSTDDYLNLLRRVDLTEIEKIIKQMENSIILKPKNNSST